MTEEPRKESKQQQKNNNGKEMRQKSFSVQVEQRQWCRNGKVTLLGFNWFGIVLQGNNSEQEIKSLFELHSRLEMGRNFKKWLFSTNISNFF